MIEALRVTPQENLLPLSQLLYRSGIAHRISEQAGDQVVWVKKEDDIEQVRSIYQRLPDLVQGMPVQRASAAATKGVSWRVVQRQLRRSPIITGVILISVLVTLGMSSGSGGKVYALLQMSMPQIIQQGQLWRLVTPVFLHFNLMHLVFNMLMLWVFGRQVEARESWRTLTALLLITAVVSNYGQYVSTGSGFGGMSGVVYGVMAFCWQWDRMNPQQPYGFPSALMGFMLFWLVLGYTDVLAWVGFGHMANEAHLIGLLCGLICAFCLTLLRIPNKRSKHPFN